jgi:hypothetical protein
MNTVGANPNNLKGITSNSLVSNDDDRYLQPKTSVQQSNRIQIPNRIRIGRNVYHKVQKSNEDITKVICSFTPNTESTSSFAKKVFANRNYLGSLQILSAVERM